MRLVDFIALLLNEGRYDVDVLTGAVTNLRTGNTLTTTVGEDGYPAVTLHLNRNARRVRIHRIIAVKVWGAEAAYKYQVAHLDGVPSRNSVDNLKLMTARDHILYDGTMNLPNMSPKTSWPPCSRCNDPNGRRSYTHGRTPVRVSGHRFGWDGILCGRCYELVRRTARRVKTGINHALG